MMVLHSTTATYSLPLKKRNNAGTPFKQSWCSQGPAATASVTAAKRQKTSNSKLPSVIENCQQQGQLLVRLPHGNGQKRGQVVLLPKPQQDILLREPNRTTVDNHEDNVICVRGRKACGYPGNRRLRVLVRSQMKRYSQATSKANRSNVVSDIIKVIRGTGGNFVRYNDDQSGIVLLSERMTREKVGQALRDALSDIYSSSSANKTKRRKALVQYHEVLICEIVNQNEAIQDTLEYVELKLGSSETSMPDIDVEKLFESANAMILKELKASNSARAFEIAVQALTSGDSITQLISK